MQITELSVFKGDTYKLELSDGQTFFVNCAIVTDFDLHKGGEISGDKLRQLQLEDTKRKAKKRALVACLFAISGLICWCGISQVIGNSVSSSMENAFGITPMTTAIILTAVNL